MQNNGDAWASRMKRRRPLGPSKPSASGLVSSCSGSSAASEREGPGLGERVTPPPAQLFLSALLRVQSVHPAHPLPCNTTAPHRHLSFPYCPRRRRPCVRRAAVVVLRVARELAEEHAQAQHSPKHTRRAAPSVRSATHTCPLDILPDTTASISRLDTLICTPAHHRRRQRSLTSNCSMWF